MTVTFPVAMLFRLKRKRPPFPIRTIATLPFRNVEKQQSAQNAVATLIRPAKMMALTQMLAKRRGNVVVSNETVTKRIVVMMKMVHRPKVANKFERLLKHEISRMIQSERHARKPNARSALKNVRNCIISITMAPISQKRLSSLTNLFWILMRRPRRSLLALITS